MQIYTNNFHSSIFIQNKNKQDETTYITIKTAFIPSKVVNASGEVVDNTETTAKTFYVVSTGDLAGNYILADADGSAPELPNGVTAVSGPYTDGVCWFGPIWFGQEIPNESATAPVNRNTWYNLNITNIELPGSPKEPEPIEDEELEPATNVAITLSILPWNFKNIEVNLQSFGSFDKLTENMDGSFYLKSPEMLISNLALDYLNGGDAKTRDFKVQDLSAALYDRDCGLYELNLLGSVKRGNIYVSGNFNLSSDSVTANMHLDLNTMLISALGIIENKLEGNTTQISVSNKLNDPKITIKPIQRGTIRPGLSDIDKTEESQKTQALEHASQS